MSDEIETPPRAYNTPDLGSHTVPHRGGRRWKAILAAVILTPIVGVAVWTVLAMTYTYSQGERVGYVQKFSDKGWLCKTWEGELALSNVPGQVPEKFYFTVRDDSIATAIQDAEGGRVAIHYRQHKGIPFSCFGETEYFVDAVRPARQ